MDTFWWHVPKELLSPGQDGQHVVGISLFDEATDYHTIVVVRQGKQPQHVISGKEFKEGFLEGWVKRFPIPQKMRYDEEGYMRGFGLISWLEGLGIKMEPIGGESAWQMGKHSRHLQVLKENANLLAYELGAETDAKELLSLAVMAKNEVHNIKGYTPNQWQFGANHGRISSFLRFDGHLPWDSQREDLDFEASLKKEAAARKLFIEADAQRRLQRALRGQSRPLREYSMGQLVYYYRRDRKEGTRVAGRWHGPGRVLCHEKTSEQHLTNHPGSIVWVSHAGFLLRCSPEQLRPVTHDVQQIDMQINGASVFETMYKTLRRQQKFHDLIEENADVPDVSPDMNVPRFRCQGKRSLDVDSPPDPRPPDFGESHERFKQARVEPQGEPGQTEALDKSCERQGPGREGQDHATDRTQEHEDRLRQAQGTDIRGSSSSTGIRRMGSQPCEPGEEQSNDADVCGIPEPPHQSVGSTDGDSSRIRGHKRRPSDGDREHQETWGSGSLARREDREGRLRQGVDRDDGGTFPRDDSTAGRDQRAETAHGTNGGSAVADRREVEHRVGRSDQQRHRSRTPHRDPRNIRQEESTDLSGPVQLSTIPEDGSEKMDILFARAVETTHTVEIHLCVSARDVHCKRGIWVLNQKAKRNVEVNLRKLSEEDRKEFEKAMGNEVDSFTSNSAVEICASAGIPRERILGTRWVLVWKPIQDEHGVEVGRKAKARLILKGYQDPELLSVPREAATLSTLGRNTILSLAAQRRFKVYLGDIKTAYLNGDQTELERNIWAEPPEEVKQYLNMKPHELWRVAKAVYGLCHAPRKWFEKLQATLLSQHWQSHQLDQCVFILTDPATQEICGYLGAHVDDLVVAGAGVYFEEQVRRLRDSFPFGS